ncbi:methylated-DNA--[protein]-cysteine S-methyltransferase [Paenalkalicoccus suaedae]|uniref:Methylated-DNA--protein-cysteine methyltransferase n=1 Tax=Paenalkalicoccus suaedae TaxID=2592382 RepID=A0A859FCS1_9BACI|nr:methylated-DNA--[protein]-cysteine S-methyltransferase [Paenalkalicoccus suaedae]QKS70638.1 methylated-DNA--[protein]-cysteine S-methyltransferase [Paenalkalicoccus suaedae]
MSVKLAYTEISSPIGVLTVVGSDNALHYIEFGEAKDAHQSITRKSRARNEGIDLYESREALTNSIEQLEAYFNHELRAFELELHYHGTPFQKLVWEAVSSIPFGETRSYKDIAQQIGAPKAVRAVGGANNKNPIPIVVPCHRVIGSNGSMVGYGGGLPIKEHLLKMEGSI